MLKRIIALIMCGAMASSILVGCSNNAQSDEASNSTDDKISVVCTTFPQYDWTKQIVGDNDNIELTLLLNNGTDLHNYQPTADDIIKISDCDMFIYVGGESDAWVDDILNDAQNKDMKVISLMDIVGDSAKEEEMVEGMQTEEEHSDEDEIEYDEHIWLSLKNAETVCNAISQTLSDIDTQNSDSYTSNAEVYVSNLKTLDEQYKTMVDTSTRKTVLFGDRFPFRYLVDDYNIDYYAAFVGCSTESEASFDTIIFLANKVDELSLPIILTIDGSNQAIANTIKDNTSNKNQTILTMNSMQSVNSKDVENGVTYLSIMEDNLDVLKQALN